MSEQFDVKAYYKMWEKRITPIINILYPFTVYGKENIIDKPCLVCANHSNYIDPILVALAFTGEHPIHFMAKAELFKNKLLAGLMEKLGAFGVDRDGADISAVRAVMK